MRQTLKHLRKLKNKLREKTSTDMIAKSKFMEFTYISLIAHNSYN